MVKIETVNAVTMAQGQQFAKRLFEGTDIGEACDETGILTWPGDDDDDASDDAAETFHALTNDICRRVYEAVREQIAETFVRVANAAIDAERQREESPLVPPRIETVPVVTPEHGETLLEEARQLVIDSGNFTTALAETHIMTWPDDEERDAEEAQKHFNDLADEIRDRLHEETKPLIVEAFVRIANDVTSRERRRR